MSTGFPPSPQPPDWAIDWIALDANPWLRDLKGCPQNPIRHAEGDVWTHVHMVCEAMAALPEWRALPEHDRTVVFTASLFHDVAKPACTRIESDGSVSSRGHSWRGAVRTRQILWRRGVPFEVREQIAAMVRHHLVPFFLSDSERPEKLAIEVSQTIPCHWLSLLSEADARGRICPDPDHLLQQIKLFRNVCEAAGCLNQTYTFPSDDSRFAFFHADHRKSEGGADREWHTEVVLMSGLPGAGKDNWLKQNLPDALIISLDDLRSEMGVPPSDPQGVVLSRAKEMARDYLQERRPFVWNSPNLSRNVRQDCVKLFQELGARTRIVYVEVPPDRLFAQNRQRRRKVPESVIERLLDRWEVPDRTEAHRVEWVVS